ncbi:MAG: hypothetical protein LAO07_01375 [Acidobacteriia bacterium]|nr:hypothetical protein [Terriglobia bacterium]
MEPLAILHHVTSKLESLKIPYMVGGSFAGSYYGFARNTQDADVIVAMRQAHVDGFLSAFGGEFYLDRGSIEDALRRRASFNIIHLESSFKVDFFVLRDRSFDQESFARRRLARIDPDIDLESFLQSAEDTVLAKLEWYRLGGGVSEIQWRDIQGILKAQAERLDSTYLHRWAQELGVSDLLARAIEEAGVAGH